MANFLLNVFIFFIKRNSILVFGKELENQNVCVHLKLSSNYQRSHNLCIKKAIKTQKGVHTERQIKHNT